MQCANPYAALNDAVCRFDVQAHGDSSNSYRTQDRLFDFASGSEYSGRDSKLQFTVALRTPLRM
ncbi:hypothetical protein ARMGADRAFT_749929 [Armillaria gallica]|uniref:Uncharacterized protein n=1 Tax=Armillaria gallica TaxID=47427 RepID=A0A2H3DKT1_ARMGA|nr:hypothetical protein ARMGADRAFT_749929 [Armillaria gallica]